VRGATPRLATVHPSIDFLNGASLPKIVASPVSLAQATRAIIDAGEAREEPSHGTARSGARTYFEVRAHPVQSAASVIDCTVRNLSPGGACLNVTSTLGIPSEFEVLFDADNTMRVCHVVWHKEKQLGVAFSV
jgi:PilZ domain